MLERGSRLGLRSLVGVGVGGITDQLPVRLRVPGGPQGQEDWQELPLGMWPAMASRLRAAASVYIPNWLSDHL